MGVFGSSTPSRLAVPSGAAGAFPKGYGTYTSPDGAIVVPPGALDNWWQWNQTQSAAERRAVVSFGDSTWYGSGAGYSVGQRLRDRSVAAGYADGGKGLFAGLEQEITYDPPEVNGIVSTTFNGTTDSYDTLVGSFLFSNTASQQQVCQFRTTSLRIWYMRRGTAGQFTYRIDGGTTVTVDASGTGNPKPLFVWITGLAANTTHTVTIVNTGGAEVHVALDPVNDVGVQWQKQAISGATFSGFFYGSTTAPAPYTQAHDGFRFQAPMGLTPNVTVQGSDGYAGMTIDTTIPLAQRIRPVLATTNLGFNDLTNNSSDGTTAVYWQEYVRRFAAACRAASCSGIVIAGQLPYNANWPTYGAARFNMLKSEAIAQGLAFVDLFYPVGGPSLSYAGGTSNPHLTKTQYVAQADYLWDNLLGH